MLTSGARIVLRKCKVSGSAIVAVGGAAAQLVDCRVVGDHGGVGVFASGVGTHVRLEGTTICNFEEGVCVEAGAQVWGLRVYYGWFVCLRNAVSCTACLCMRCGPPSQPHSLRAI